MVVKIEIAIEGEVTDIREIFGIMPSINAPVIEQKQIEPVKEIAEVKEEPVVAEAPKKRRKNRRRIMPDTPEGQAVIIHNKNGHQVSWIANKVGRTYRQVWDFLKDNGYEINKKTS
jgi:hypothetical protein